MSLSITLNNALSALNVNQQSLAVLSQNIANANTAGYSRQILNQQAVYLDGQGAGVTITDVTRKVDAYLQKSMQLQNSIVGQSSVIKDYNDRIQLMMGTPGSSNSIDSYSTLFFNALQTLSQTPDDSTLQQLAVNSGSQYAGQVQQLATGLRSLQYQADQDIRGAVDAVNNDLVNLSRINSSIANNKILGKGVADLEDQRDKLISDISQYMDVQTFQRDNGAINLTTAGGVSLLDDNVYQLSYTPAGSPVSFSDGTPLQALQLYRVDSNGNKMGTPVTLATAGTSGNISTLITGGKIRGLMDLRDKDIPNMMGQLDNLAATVRDQVNAIHNAGSSYPGAQSYTGTRLVTGSQSSNWSGSAMIAVLNANGQPVISPYGDEPNGMRPLTLDFDTLNGSNGMGNPSVQDIIDAINQYYGVPQNKAQVGNLNNIQMVSDSASIPGVPPSFSFDFNLDNLSDGASNFYVTGVSVADNNGNAMTPVASGVPSLALNPSSTYTTIQNSSTVIVHTTLPHGLKNGDTVYLSDPGTSIDGIPGTALAGYFTIRNVTDSGFEISATAGTATTGMNVGVTGQTAMPPYGTVAAGDTMRTLGNGSITASLANNSTAAYYTVTVNVGVKDGAGNISTSQISYKVYNQQSNLLNTRFGAESVAGGGLLVQPSTLTPVATAKLVDANGVELPKVNGHYAANAAGYLQISTGSSSSVIAIDSLNSAEQGQPYGNPATTGSGRGFSHYFDLNDFFASNQPSVSGDTVKGSALNLAVSQRLLSNPGLVSLGTMSRKTTSATELPNYNYERNPGDNSIAQRLAGLGNKTLNFDATGGLGKSSQTLTAYAAAIVGVAATSSANATANATSNQTLMDGYTQRSSSISGVNLDEELANTVVYQNAYSASARIVTVVNSLFDTLLSSFN